MKSQLYSAVLNFLLTVDKDLHSLICVESYRNELICGLKKTLENSPNLLKMIVSWDIFSSILAKLVREFEKIVEPIEARVYKNELSIERAKKLLLRIIPTIEVTGYEHILYAISKCSEESSSYVNSIYPNFANEYEYCKYVANNPQGYFYEIMPEDDIETVLSAAMRNDPSINGKIFNARVGRLSSAHFRSCVSDYCKEEPLNLRPYQEELVEDACKGENVIICAPTGSGKTVVGAYIVRNHIYESRRDGRYSKTCFIVPTNNLVQQQETVFRKYVGHCAKVKGISGGNPLSQPNRLTIKDADVVVITPQILLNVITEKPIEGFAKDFEPFDLTEFTLIIFDEAHHTRDDHPYNVLMGEHYHDLKLTGAFHTNRRLPQIIGMTASLGIGGSASSTFEKAVEYILLTCANLDTNRISRVRKFKDSLQDFMPDVFDDIHIVNLENYSATRFYKLLIGEIEHLKTLMLEIPEVINDEVYEKLSDQNSRDPLLVAFANWAYCLKSWISEAPNLSEKSRELLKLYDEQILIFYDAITDMRLFGAKTALESIEGRETDFFYGKSGTFIAHLEHVIKLLNESLQQNPHEDDSPLLTDLIGLLDKQFSVDGQSRVIIFLKQRDFCKKLSTLLAKKTTHPTSYITGQNASEDSGGQTINQQKANIQNFAKGNIRVLCATTVAEEGLDISACNLVIQYNNVTNEIARVQRRGRGRAKKAKSILFACDEEVKQKEEQNKSLEALMDETLEVIGQMPQIVFRHKVEEQIDKLNEKRKLARALDDDEKSRRRALTLDHDYFIVCSRCSSYLGSSERIAAVKTQYVLADKDIWNKVKTKKLPSDAKNYDKLTKMNTPLLGIHNCACPAKDVSTSGINECRNEIGRIIRFRNVFLPLISLEGVVFVKSKFKGQSQKEWDGTGERKTKKKWKDVLKELFYAEPITSLLLTEMKAAKGAPEHLSNSIENNLEEILS